MGAKSTGRPRGRRAPRAEKERLLVVTEGKETEPLYVERLEAYLCSMTTTAVVKRVAVGKDPLRVVAKCIEIRDQEKRKGKEKEFDWCFCLVDRDEHASLPRALALAESEGICVLVSNLKFEVWLRWHVEDGRGSLSSKDLDKIVAKHGLLSGKKLPLSFPIGEVERACARAKLADPDLACNRLGPDPSTAMPILVDAIGGKILSRDHSAERVKR